LHLASGKPNDNYPHPYDDPFNDDNNHLLSNPRSISYPMSLNLENRKYTLGSGEEIVGINDKSQKNRIRDRRVGFMIGKRSLRYGDYIRRRILNAVNSLGENDWKVAQDYTGVQVVGNKQLQKHVKEYMVNLLGRLDFKDKNLHSKLKTEFDSLMERQSHRLIRRGEQYSAGAYVLVGLFFFVLLPKIVRSWIPPSDAEIDERYYHPDQGEELRQGESPVERDERLERVRQDKRRWYNDDMINIAASTYDQMHHGTYDQMHHGTYDQMHHGTYDQIHHGTYDQIHHGTYDQMHHGTYDQMHHGTYDLMHHFPSIPHFDIPHMHIT
jgi:hypothetical protein